MNEWKNVYEKKGKLFSIPKGWHRALCLALMLLLEVGFWLLLVSLSSLYFLLISNFIFNNISLLFCYTHPHPPPPFPHSSITPHSFMLSLLLIFFILFTFFFIFYFVFHTKRQPKKQIFVQKIFSSISCYERKKTPTLHFTHSTLGENCATQYYTQKSNYITYVSMLFRRWWCFVIFFCLFRHI